MTVSTPTSMAVFDLLNCGSGAPAKDSQGGFNLHLMALRIPIEELGGDQQIVGVYATTSRQKVHCACETKRRRQKQRNSGSVGAGRAQGNPLFNEALVAIVDKDLYSRTSPSDDANSSASMRSTRNSRADQSLVFAARTAGHRDQPDRYRGHLYPRLDQGGSLDAGRALRRQRPESSDESG